MRISKDFFDAFVTFSSTLLGVIAGGVITYQLNLRFEKKMIRKQLRIAKIQELLSKLSAATRDVCLLDLRIREYMDTRIDKDKLEEELLKSEENLRVLFEYFNLNNTFFKRFAYDFGTQYKAFVFISNSIYYKYCYPDHKNASEYKDINYEQIKNKIDDFMEISNHDIYVLKEEIEKELL
ncbi:hypothetical protein [Clostridium botulinum]|uniref:hypothetical protein n=1 Tax=Clostridium botulinum TaxID=1491 RepID=UPI0007DEC1D8|nr:hypothetical protein [Clostridium botulinum]KEI75895.1 hypothetical protein N486_08995 [Clostridium botulinum B2 128]KEI92041.1 hypothetical protein N491_09145 [Clostridium botulinum B2 275]